MLFIPGEVLHRRFGCNPGLHLIFSRELKKSTVADVGRSGVFRIRILKRRLVFANHAAHLRGFLRQHFLKREAVFFDVLVYSE